MDSKNVCYLLRSALKIAVDNNLTVQRSNLNLQSAQVNLLQAQAQRYPTLNFNGNYGYNWGRGIDPTTNQFIDQRINFNGVSGSANMPHYQRFCRHIIQSSRAS